MIDVNEIELDGKIYVAEETDPDNDCRGCAFERLSGYCARIMCYSGDRADGRTVIFVEKQNDGTGEIAPVIQETQEGKIATEVVTNNNETESLDSLFNQIVLLQKENDSLVEQKEQLVNKISANTQSINIMKDKMSEKVGSVGLVLAGVDKATDYWKFVSRPNK